MLDSYQKFIYLRTYSRFVNEKGRRETWEETVQRYMDYMRSKLGKKLREEEYEEIHQAIETLEVMPSMRLLWTAGPAVEKSHAMSYNCSFTTPTKIKSFGEILYLLTCGCGVGYSVERKFVDQLPVIEPQDGGKKEVYVVPDTREGWADALVDGMRAWYEGKDVTFDYSKIRPLGAPLKSMGGRASGPAPLKDLLEHTRRIVLSRQGMRLRPIDAHDIITKIGDIVVVGGTRRSAQISLSDLGDDEMRHAKVGAFWEHSPHRAMANNSAVYSEKPDIKTFTREWLALMESGTGERGIFVRNGRMPERRRALLGTRVSELGTNPCFHPDTIIETVHGRKKIKDIVSPTKVYTMEDDGSLGIRESSASWKTKENTKVVTVKISTGKTLTVTPDHQIYVLDKGWVAASDLIAGDTVVHLSRQRRGASYIGIKLTSEPCNAYRMEHRFVFDGCETEGKSLSKHFDVHHIDGDTHNNDIDNLECLTHAEHATLTRSECENNHQVRGEDGKFISGSDSRFGAKEIRSLPDELKANLVNQYPRVESVEDAGLSDVYDISVAGTNNVIANYIVAHNCGEILLQPRQFCNLSEVVARAGDTRSSLARKIRIAAILGTFQSSLCDFGYLSAEWTKTTAEERLLGVSITGQYDSEEARKPATLRALRDLAVETNSTYARRFGIPASTSVTAVKPSGTVSQLVDAASGIHPRYSEYYIRRVRISSVDPLYKLLRDAGVPCQPEVGQTEDTATVFVLQFPRHSPEGAVTTDQVGGVQQLEYWRTVKENYTEHNPSCTIHVKDDEWLEVGAWVYRNWDIVGGLSFLPRDSNVYQLAPYEAIDRRTYERLLREFPEVDYERLLEYESNDNTLGAREAACVSGLCDIL